MAYSSKYSIELVDRNGQLLADLSGRASKRRITQSRNEAETIIWYLDLNEFEKYCRDINVNPKQIIVPGYTEVRIKRLGTYFVGGQINYMNPHLSASDQSIEVRASGFLDLFIKRFTGTTDAGTVGEIYTAANGSQLSRQDLAWSLINQSQALVYGNFGITRGVTKGSTTLYDKTYSQTNIKDALQDMTKLQTAPIDIEFTYDKKFNCYAQMGSIRNDITFDFPGNILDIGAPVDATTLANQIQGVGQGADLAQSIFIASDNTSQATYALRQDIYISNGTDNSDNGITDATNARLAALKVPVQVPTLIVDGGRAPFITDYSIGDRVPVKAASHSMFADINGYYRVEKRIIDIDENDKETVTLMVSAL